MKILFVHNKYQRTGGEDTVLDSEMALLADWGHDICLAAEDNHAIDSVSDKIRTFRDVVYSSKHKHWMTEKLREFLPDVVHVHNFFPLISPSVYDACQEAGVPVVQTLHNYRTICPGALLMRKGQICEKCITGSPYQAVFHKCYRDSAIGSLGVARMVSHHRHQDTWKHKVNGFIALTEFARGKFSDAGFPNEKIHIKPNFVAEPLSRLKDPPLHRQGALFVGRLSAEKGLTTLLRAWQHLDIPLRVAGSGPLSADIARFSSSAANNSAVVALGALDHAEVQAEMASSAFLVMPSEWYEGFPMVLVEAFANGLPVVVSRLGAMAEIVEDGVTGLHFEAGNSEDLAEKVRWLNAHPEARRLMGKNARSLYQTQYTPTRNYQLLMDIYQQAIAGQ